MDLHSLGLPQEWLSQAVVVNRPEYIISYQQYGPCTFVHCHVSVWNRKVRSALHQDVEQAFALHGGPVYAIASSEKQKRFDAMYGFKPTGMSAAAGEILVKEKEENVLDLRRWHNHNPAKL